MSFKEYAWHSRREQLIVMNDSVSILQCKLNA